MLPNSVVMMAPVKLSIKNDVEQKCAEVFKASLTPILASLISKVKANHTVSTRV